jgi:flavin reductase (DIM6/NTAB) family NADH-FMN oxidoreductase RutF
MNILTYATPVSVKPDRLWAIGLYKGTQTHENFVKLKQGVLQLLTDEHTPLVKLLGGTSGYDVDKQEESKALGFDWVQLEEEEPRVLQGCSSYLCLELHQGNLIDGGSHDIAICRVKSMHTDELHRPQLSTEKLRDLGIITEQGRVAD